MPKYDQMQYPKCQHDKKKGLHGNKPKARTQYTIQEKNIPKYTRTVFIRIRLSSHNLKIETDRWARIPRDQRMCQCGEEIQSEEHVLLRCPISRHVTETFITNTHYDYAHLEDLFRNMENKKLAELCFQVLKLYE